MERDVLGCESGGEQVVILTGQSFLQLVLQGLIFPVAGKVLWELGRQRLYVREELCISLPFTHKTPVSILINFMLL